LFILPNSNSNSPELSARMDSLELISDKNYVNLKDLIFLFKIFPDESGIHLDIKIKEFIYPNFNYTSFNFENLHFNMEIGLNGQSFDISINLPTLSLINKNYKLNLSDLNLNIGLSDLKLSNLDLSILLSDFNYTNFDDVHVNMDNINVSLEPILNVNSFDIIIKMDSFDTAGVTFNDMFPMLNIDTIKLKNSTTDMESPINLTGHISPIDIYQMDLASIASLLSSGFDLNTYMRNMPDYDSYLDVDANDSSGFNLESIFKNFDNSSLDGIVLNLSGIIDSAGIDLSDLGIDVSGYDLSAIKLSDIICILNKSNLNISTITSIYKLFTSDLDNQDKSGLIVSFDSENFDISSLLASLNLSGMDISGILDMLDDSDLDLEKIFKNCDLSCLDGMVLDLSELIDSAGIDLSKLGIDVSGYDLSKISLSDVIDILNKSDVKMSTITALLTLFNFDLGKTDLSGLIASFNWDNFDISQLLAGLNISTEDISGILGIFNNSDLDLDSIFENCDYSCLNAIVLDLSGMVDSADVDLSELGIDVSGYDLSKISLSDVIDILNKSDFIKSLISAMLKLFNRDWERFDTSELIVSFDSEKMDINAL